MPELVGLTDRVDARRTYVGSASLMAVANFGFAAAAEGFWSAMVLRALSGVAVAGTCMPGSSCSRTISSLPARMAATAIPHRCPAKRRELADQ